jgi:peptide/nickel transport system substrate-binding protein
MDITISTFSNTEGVYMAGKLKIGKIVVTTLITILFASSTIIGQTQSEERLVKISGGTDWGYPGPFSFYSRGPGYYKMALIFEALVERNETGYIPWLAKSWVTSEDGLVWTFSLRDDVYWSDGEKFTADDVLFTFDYYSLHPYGWADLSIIKSVEKINDYTVAFSTAEPVAPFISQSIESQQIIPKHIWEAVDDPLTYHESEPGKSVIGTGPYMLVDYDSAAGTYLFRENPDYWYGDPAVDEIQFNPVSASTELEAFLAGELSTCRLDADSITLLPDDEKYVVVTTPAFWGYKLYFNPAIREELGDVELRQAFAYAIDRQDIVDRVGLGLGLSGNPGYLTKSHAWYNPGVKKYDPDPKMAMSLIESIGYVMGEDGYYQLDGEALEFTLLTGTDTYLTVAEEIKDDLEAVGIKVTINSVDTKTRDSLVSGGEYELAINGHGGWGGDADLLRTLFTDFAGAPSAFSIPGFDLSEELQELLEAQLVETDEAARKEMVYKIQEIIAEELPILPIWNTQSYFVYNSDVHDGWYFPFNHHVAEHPKLSYILGTVETDESLTESDEPETAVDQPGNSDSSIPGFPVQAIALAIGAVVVYLFINKRAYHEKTS